jgi:hypothetical protein
LVYYIQSDKLAVGFPAADAIGFSSLLGERGVRGNTGYVGTGIDQPGYLSVGDAGESRIACVFDEVSFFAEEVLDVAFQGMDDGAVFGAGKLVAGELENNSVIKLSYREFTGDMARPAFTVDVSYDLGESDEIAYKQVRLKILEASNTSITYMIIHNFY